MMNEENSLVDNEIYLKNIISFLKKYEYIKDKFKYRSGYSSSYARLSIYHNESNSIWINFEIGLILYQFTYHKNNSIVKISSYCREDGSINLMDVDIDQELDLTELILINGKNIFNKDLINLFLTNYQDFLIVFDEFINESNND